MKIQTFALGCATLALVILAGDRSGATAGAGWETGVQQNQSNASRGQATPPRHDPKGTPQPRLPWWKDPAIVKEISLTLDQSSKIDAIWRRREKDMKATAAEYDRQQAELNRLMAERKVGIDVLGVQHDRVEAHRTILNKSRTIALYQTSLILSVEQNKALKAYWERNRRDRR